MTHIDELKSIVNDTMNLAELVKAFETISIPHSNDDDYDVLFEYGNFDFTGEEKFYFSLALQWPGDDDEYMQLHMDVVYPVLEICNDRGESIWAFEFESYQEFFDAIRNQKVFKYLTENNIPYQKLDIVEEET